MNAQGERYNSTRQAWQAIWDQASMQVELEAAASPRSRATINRYLPYLDKDEPHLEAGSGLSAIVISLRQLGYSVQGIDYAWNALRESRRYDESLPLAAADVHHLPYRDSSFGGYLSFGVLEHFEHGLLPALQEAHRVLKPGGVLVLTIPYPNLVYRLVQMRRARQGSGKLSDDAFYESAYTRRQLSEAVAAARFRLEEIHPTSHAFTLWGLGACFRQPGYYKTNRLADNLGALLSRILPWAFNFSTLVIARKPASPLA